MDKKSKVLIWGFILIIFVSIFFTYKRSFLDKNFTTIEVEEAGEETSE